MSAGAYLKPYRFEVSEGNGERWAYEQLKTPKGTVTHTYININLPSLGQLRWERCSNGSEDRTPHPISTSPVLSSESYTIQYIHTYMEESVYLDRSIYKYKASKVRDLTSALLSVATNSNKDQSHSILG